MKTARAARAASMRLRSPQRIRRRKPRPATLAPPPPVTRSSSTRLLPSALPEQTPRWARAVRARPSRWTSAASSCTAHPLAETRTTPGMTALARAATAATSGKRRPRRALSCTPAPRRTPLSPPPRHPAPPTRRGPPGRQAVVDGLGRRGAPWHRPPHLPSLRRPRRAGARHAVLHDGMPRPAPVRHGALFRSALVDRECTGLPRHPPRHPP